MQKTTDQLLKKHIADLVTLSYAPLNDDRLRPGFSSLPLINIYLGGAFHREWDLTILASRLFVPHLSSLAMYAEPHTKKDS